MGRKLTVGEERRRPTVVIELVVKEVIFGPIKEDKISIGNVLASKLLMKSNRSGLLIQAVENADPATICDLLMKGLTTNRRAP